MSVQRLFRLSSASGHARVLVAGLIAMTSLLGSLVAWRASVANTAAGGADGKGLADLVAAQQARVQAFGNTDLVYRDYLAARALRAQADALRAEGANAGQAPDVLIAQADAYDNAADLAEQRIDPDVVAPDGSIDIQRKVDIELALAASSADLDPTAEFARADQLHRKGQRLTGLAALLITAALFFTLAQVTRDRAHQLYLVGGVGVLGVALLLFVVFEAFA